jgi:hypothetical protein
MLGRARKQGRADQLCGWRVGDITEPVIASYRPVPGGLPPQVLGSFSSLENRGNVR